MVMMAVVMSRSIPSGLGPVRSCVVWMLLALICVCALSHICQAGKVLKPEIKWEKGGCRWPDNDGSWDYGCKQSWYGQPYVGDIDGDGTVDIVGGNYLTYMLDGETGIMDWYVQAGCDINNQDTCTGSNRMWPDVAVADLDGDGDLEYVTAHGGSLLCVYNADGTYHKGWENCKTPRSDGAEIRAMTIADLDSDGQFEIMIGYARADSVNLYLLDNKGNVLPGWPQRQESTVGSSWFIGSNSIGVADLAGDKTLEIISPSDTTRVMAYHMDGTPVRGFASPDDPDTPRSWGEINNWEHQVDEDRGWASCSESNIRVNGIRSCTSIADLDGDGEIEIAFTGNAYDCSVGDNDAGKKFTGLFVVDKFRKRYHTSKGDWESIPSSMGPMKLKGGTEIITWNQYTTPTDLDGDGELELLTTAMDGKLHAWWLDQTEKHSWPFAPPEDHYLTEPVIVDIDRDGTPEVITNSWTRTGSNKYGKLFVLSNKGVKLYELDLPVPPNHDFGGSYTAPIACNLDNDGNLDILVMQIWQGITAYTIPKSSNHRIISGMSRGNWFRNGNIFDFPPCVGPKSPHGKFTAHFTDSKLTVKDYANSKNPEGTCYRIEIKYPNKSWKKLTACADGSTFKKGKGQIIKKLTGGASKTVLPDSTPWADAVFKVRVTAWDRCDDSSSKSLKNVVYK